MSGKVFSNNILIFGSTLIVKNLKKLSVQKSTRKSPNLIFIQSEKMQRRLWDLECLMEQFYTSGIKRSSVSDRELIGKMVATVDRDMNWHRGHVINVNHLENKAEILMVDYGWHSSVKIEFLRRLDSQFSKVPPLVFSVGLSGIRSVGGLTWPAQAVSYIRNLFDGEGRGWVRVKDKGQVELFTVVMGKKICWVSVGEQLVLKNLAETIDGYSHGQMNRDLLTFNIEDSKTNASKLNSETVLQNLVLSCLCNS